MDYEKMKNEAFRRLEILKSKGLMHCVLRDFRKKDTTVYMSEFNGLCGALFYFNDLGGAKQEWIDLVKQFEDDHECLVYHITHEITGDGEMLDLFFVSKYEEEWSGDREELRDNYTHAYVINLTVPHYSEFGIIMFRTLGGGLVRTDYMY